MNSFLQTTLWHSSQFLIAVSSIESLCFTEAFSYTFFQPVNYTTFSLKGVTVPCSDDTTFKKINLMILENIQVLPLPELLDLLVSTTTQMHNLMRQKGGDDTAIREMRKDVQLIQSAI